MTHSLPAVAPPSLGAKGAARDLLDHLRRLEGHRGGAYAVHLHLSRPGAQIAHPNVQRIVARPFEELASVHDGRLFGLPGGDLVFVCREVPVDDVDAAVRRTRHLFREETTAATGEGHPFDTWYDLSDDGDFRIVTGLARTIIKETERDPLPASGRSDPPAQTVRLSDVTDMQRRLRDIQVGDLVRQQPAIAIRPGGDAMPLFREVFISIPALQKRLKAKINLFDCRWLFQYLSETLDRRLMARVARDGLAEGAVPISLNLNMDTAGSREFRHFQRAFGGGDGALTVEFQLVDVLANSGAYPDLRDELHRNGCRVLIDGVSPLSLSYLNLNTLRADLVKFWWRPDLPQALSPTRLTEVREGIAAAGRERIVLARTESMEAVEWALRLGITRFQGRLIDRIVAARGGKAVA